MKESRKSTINNQKSIIGDALKSAYHQVNLISLILILFLVFFPGEKSFAQTNSEFRPLKDFGTWTSFDIDKKIKKHEYITWSEQLRLYQNSTAFKSLFSDIGFEKDFSKKFSVNLDYLMIARGNYQPLQHRLYADFNFTKKINSVTVEARIRLQKKFELNKLPENYIRPKITLKYKIIKPLKLFIAAEGFYNVSYAESQFDDLRFFCGTEYYYSNSKSIKIYYAYDRNINVASPVLMNVLGISWGIDL